jgi:hypothetical protein
MQPRSDDLSIGNEEKLWRRIAPSLVHKESESEFRPNSGAFLDRNTNEVSVHIASLTTPERALKDYPEHSLVEIPAGLPRSLGYAIVRDPTEKDPSHALICPPLGRTGNPIKSDSRKMAKEAKWIVLKPPASISPNN